MADKKYNFFESYHRALSRVPDESYGRVVRAMSYFVFAGIEPNLTETVDLVAWELIKPILEKGTELSQVRADAGRSGGINGKGIPRNAGNRHAAKVQKQTKANQKQIISGKGEGIGERNKETTNVAKKDELSLKTLLSERKKKFQETISPYIDEYGADMCNDFFEYWTEPTPNGKKMKFELQKTWDVKRRLSRWYNSKK